MAEQNLHLNKLLSDPVYFSDLCNGVLFRGRLYLRPEDLMPVKGSQGVLYADRKGFKKVLERRRDVAMRVKNGTRYAVIAVENQANIHYAMVIRSLLYDALDYADQVQIQEKELRQAGRRPSGDGFLSGVGPDSGWSRWSLWCSTGEAAVGTAVQACTSSWGLRTAGRKRRSWPVTYRTTA